MGKIRMRMRPTEMTPWISTTVRSTTARSQTGQAMYLLEAVACPAVQVTLPEPTLLRLAGMSKYTSAQRARPEHYVFRSPRKCRISRYISTKHFSPKQFGITLANAVWTIGRRYVQMSKAKGNAPQMYVSVCAMDRWTWLAMLIHRLHQHKRKCQEPCLRTTPRWIMPFTL